MNIRKAKEIDRESIQKLTSLFATSFKTDPDSFNNSFNELLKDPNSIFLVVEENETPIGYLLGFDHYTLYANGRVSWVEEIFILEDYRRKGFAKNLMTSFEEWGRNRGSKLIGLATRRAKDFYLALGYEESALFFRKLL
ncbi:GNAT family N-acetyltransferase [Leptospira santarosai]|uniref:Acetyltransferase (GNAT) domain protein n=3 Tax=Leptospira santarosai TaxID=28183 RepID=M6UN01_9LEPT|nr:GNAT family N-acetyltransferase [Leptospira santarosai]EMJ49688.1 acetyltransferase (GNAT) domain protein [Leptospira santarosai str. HAI1349]EMO44186.1 acetyltransferase (GNAT) domain protein [Leptospira santarosai str. ZUN179]EMP79753.1 acetyltransferase (GNAT) domain protein [Leptospira santarosai str. CBC1531]KXZ30580.1 acetyltransferase [Leptospira santarosai]